ncbi:MAG: SAM-dependent DNA methyltransferase [Pseudomonadota bacterium]
MSSLLTPLRRQLESAIKQARKIAEGGARHALEALAVHDPDPYQHMDEAQRTLRRQLRAQAKQLGDGESLTKRGAYEIKHLAEKLAYDQWHRLLFARYLLENNLLISPEHGVSVSLDDCEELSASLGLKDAWAVAARFAAKELPEIFRADDPAGAVELSVNDRKPLIELVTGLPVDVFTASDSLGWCYQFWQAERKDEVNAAGNKIGADELPAVTQLFTEDYMVDFLLDNTLGAWHAGKVLADKPALAETAQSEDELRNAVALPGCPWKYLRFIKTENGKWAPAAGTFDGWPKTAQELKCLDPCMGSGHFVVAMFERLVALRIAEEKRDEEEAVEEVIRDNLYGLEIDSRCTQIGAFNLALAAWRRVGHCKLPAMNLACSGLAPNAKQEDWLKLAGDSDRLQRGMARLYALFNDAPVLGSLINPRVSGGDLVEADFHELQPLVEKALAQETQDDATHEMAVTARGLTKAAEILAGQFTLVATNVPYLGSRKQSDLLKDFAAKYFPNSKEDLATTFLSRIEGWTPNGSQAVVAPQNWLYQVKYSQHRFELLSSTSLHMIARLGEGGFESPQAAGAFVALHIASNLKPSPTHKFAAIDASLPRSPVDKAQAFLEITPDKHIQAEQLRNPDYRISFERQSDHPLLNTQVDTAQGIKTGDDGRWSRTFWELAQVRSGWDFYQSSVTDIVDYGGRNLILDWSTQGDGMVRPRADSIVVGRSGVLSGTMRELPVTIYSGQRHDSSVVPLVPKNPKNLSALWAFCSSHEFHDEVRKIEKNISVTTDTLAKIPFDLTHWQKVAAEKYPHGLPKPFSSNPTQWLFNGHTKDSDQPLHVAVARLLGYQWPRQTGSSFPDCPALGPDGLETLEDEDGIVCFSATKGEAAAAERLRGHLVQALGSFDLSALLASAGPKGSKSGTLEEWLRDEFFEQHCALFHHRPFIWHIWDGHKSGFSALVNYHKLDHANLEKLTYAYLGDWIRRQQAAVDAGESGSDARLQAAKQLQTRLKLILEGEPPYDLFVRWKPLSKQAVGWHPDINDGVRMNIRPFLAQDIPGGKKGAGLLRTKPNIKWEKDRGKEPVRDKAEFPWFWGWDEKTQDFAGVGKEPDGNRWNDCHYSNEFKRKAKGG